MEKKKVKKPIYKKWWFWAIIVVVLVVALLPSDEEPEAAEPINVQLSFEPNVNTEDGSVLFGVTTNLPEDTKLMVSVKNDNGYTAQDDVVILGNGKGFTSEFSDNGNALSGKYTVEVIMSLPQLQKESVREIIGENGENLAGEFVKPSTSGECNVICAEFEFEF